MHVVSIILRRALLQYHPVAIDGIGTLRTVRSTAHFQPGQRLEPPRRITEFVATETGDLSLTDIVAGELAIDPLSAQRLCREWKQSAGRLAEENGLSDGSMVLESIGTLQINPEGIFDFFIDPDLLTLLNPLPAEPLIVPMIRRAALASRTRPAQPKHKNPHNYTLSIITILIVLTALGYLCYYLWVHTALFSHVFLR